MKTTVQRKRLLETLRIIKPFLTKSQPYRIVWLTAVENGLLLEYSPVGDGLYISRIIPGTTEGLNVIPRGLLFDSLIKVVESAGTEVTFDALTDDNGNDLVNVCLDYCMVTIQCAENEWYGGKPKWPGPGQVHYLGDLRTAVTAVLGSVAEDENMDAISCVRIRTLEGDVLAEGMNGHQYQRARAATGGSLADLIPECGIFLRRAVAKRLLPILNHAFLGEPCRGVVEFRLRTGETEEKPGLLYLGGDAGSLCLPLVNYAYPDTDSFRDRCLQSESFVRVPAGQFQRALKVFSVIGTLTNRAVTLELDPYLTLTMKHPLGYMAPVAGFSLLQAETAGSIKRIAFPATNLYRLVKDFAPDELVCLRMAGKEAPCLVTGSAHPDTETVIMPMKIVDDYYGGGDAA